MPSFLLITLAAPLASFGELAGHERRGGRERPGKSALTGLLGAALGIRRNDQEGQKALAETIETGVRIDNPGHALQDFHTAQSLKNERNFHPQTRAEALARGKRETILTKRDYRQDVLYTAAFERLENCPWTLTQLKNALEKPFFTLYLGRKSCPFSLPLAPRIIDTTDMLAALENPGAGMEDKQLRFADKATQKPVSTPYAALPAAAPTGRNASRRIERCNDQPLDRRHWHFGERREALYPLNAQQENDI